MGHEAIDARFSGTNIVSLHLNCGIRCDCHGVVVNLVYWALSSVSGATKLCLALRLGFDNLEHVTENRILHHVRTRQARLNNKVAEQILVPHVDRGGGCIKR